MGALGNVFFLTLSVLAVRRCIPILSLTGKCRIRPLHMYINNRTQSQEFILESLKYTLLNEHPVHTWCPEFLSWSAVITHMHQSDNDNETPYHQICMALKLFSQRDDLAWARVQLPVDRLLVPLQPPPTRDQGKGRLKQIGR